MSFKAVAISIAVLMSLGMAVFTTLYFTNPRTVVLQKEVKVYVGTPDSVKYQGKKIPINSVTKRYPMQHPVAVVDTPHASQLSETPPTFNVADAGTEYTSYQEFHDVDRQFWKSSVEVTAPCPASLVQLKVELDTLTLQNFYSNLFNAGIPFYQKPVFDFTLGFTIGAVLVYFITHSIIK